MVILMIFATCYGVLQLAVLGSASRTVRTSTLLLAVAAGGYGCGVLALIGEVAATRAMRAVSGRPLYEIVTTAGYTIDPLIEEVVKIIPLVAIVVVARRFRRQWGMTDYLLVGASIGAGFALVEALVRFTSAARRAMPDGDGGFLILMSLSPPQVRGIVANLGLWLPPPVATLDIFGAGSTGLNYHLVWTALAGFGLGLVVRLRGPRRWLGLLPLAYASLDHAANNYAIARPGLGGIRGLSLDGLEGLRTALPVLVFLALVLASVLDVQTLRRVRAEHPDLLLADERAGRPGVRVLGRVALVAPPWTALIAMRFVLARRALCYDLARSGADTDLARPDLYPVVVEIADRLDRARDRTRWQQATQRLGISVVHPRQLLNWRVVLWLALLVPAVAYLVVGAVPRTAGLQRLMASGVVFPVIGIAAIAAVIFVAWQLARCVRQLPATARLPWGEQTLRSTLRIGTGMGAVAAGVAFALSWWINGSSGSDRVILNLHILDALSLLTFVAAAALLIAALFFFPPVALVAVVGGGTALVLTEVAATSAALVVGAAVLGRLGILLSEAADSTGSGKSGGSSSGGSSSGKGGQNLDPGTRAQVQQKLPNGWGSGRANQKKTGTRWEDPNNPGNGVRVDMGDPNSPNPSQRVDHVVVRQNGRVIGPDGKPISGPIAQNPNSHIPLSDWLKWTNWWGP